MSNLYPVSINSRISAAWRLFFALSALALSLFLVSCGGGGGGGTTPVATCQPFADSFGRSVTCAEMNALDGANLAYLDTGGGGDGGVGDGAGDGGAGDGAPIANATLRFTDINGKEVTTHTDATGYYRISLRGLKAPLVATVVRDARPWKSMLVQDIVRAPANRNFYTINLTGLTDVVAYQTAKKEGLSSADALTPAVIARQKQVIPQIITDLNTQLKDSISAAGLDPATFNPLTSPFVANKTGYDLILESNPIVRAPDGSTVLVNTKFSFTPGDTRTYLVTPSSGASYTNTRTILATLGSEVQQLQNTYSNGSSTGISTYDDQVRSVSITYSSSGTVCNYTPHLSGYISVTLSQIAVGGSFTETVTDDCGIPGSTVTTSTFTHTSTLTGFETITTAAGTFQNARVWTEVYASSPDYKYVYWVDPIMNRPAMEKTIHVVGGVDVVVSSSELVSFSIKNYPK